MLHTHTPTCLVTIKGSLHFNSPPYSISRYPHPTPSLLKFFHSTTHPTLSNQPHFSQQTINQFQNATSKQLSPPSAYNLCSKQSLVHSRQDVYFLFMGFKMVSLVNAFPSYLIEIGKKLGATHTPHCHHYCQ